MQQKVFDINKHFVHLPFVEHLQQKCLCRIWNWSLCYKSIICISLYRLQFIIYKTHRVLSNAEKYEPNARCSKCCRLKGNIYTQIHYDKLIACWRDLCAMWCVMQCSAVTFSTGRRSSAAFNLSLSMFFHYLCASCILL